MQSLQRTLSRAPQLRGRKEFPAQLRRYLFPPFEKVIFPQFLGFFEPLAEQLFGLQSNARLHLRRSYQIRFGKLVSEYSLLARKGLGNPDLEKMFWDGLII